MKNSFISLLKTNLILQHRQGFNLAWAVISLVYIVALKLFPPSMTEMILPLVLLSEPSTFAMMFTGAIVLLEREQGLLDNLFITPLSVRQYMISKALALSLPAALSCLLISLFVTGPQLSLLIIPPVVILTMLFFVLYSFIAAARSKDIMDLLWNIALFGSPFILSVLDYFGFFAGPFHYLLPSKGTLVLMSAASGFQRASYLDIILSLLSLGFWIMMILPVSEKQFRFHVLEKESR